MTTAVMAGATTTMETMAGETTMETMAAAYTGTEMVNKNNNLQNCKNSKKSWWLTSNRLGDPGRAIFFITTDDFLRN